MNRLLKMQNTVQPYAWGSRQALADFLGEPASADNPQAELWMGAHPKAPSKVWLTGRWQSLDQVIEQDPIGILGERVSSRYSRQLPYLFKILAADQPLSIQAHPTQEQAERGYEFEENQGIPLSAGHRNYKDKNHKPECICALTPFWGVCGFRPLTDLIPLLKAVWPQGNRLAEVLFEILAKDRNLAVFFERLMTLPTESHNDLMDQIVSLAKPLAEKHAVFEWVLRLNDRYPNDVGVLSPILLNLFCLQPEEALFLPAGQLHAYFQGMGIEIMANSDNVLRGGLTPKHVDVTQLLKILSFRTVLPELIKPVALGVLEYRYPSQADEFVLSRILVNDAITYQSPASDRSAEILLCTHGEAVVEPLESQQAVQLSKGQSVLIPAAVTGYTIKGQATVYKASVN